MSWSLFEFDSSIYMPLQWTKMQTKSSVQIGDQSTVSQHVDFATFPLFSPALIKLIRPAQDPARQLSHFQRVRTFNFGKPIIVIINLANVEPGAHLSIAAPKSSSSLCDYLSELAFFLLQLH